VKGQGPYTDPEQRCLTKRPVALGDERVPLRCETLGVRLLRWQSCSDARSEVRLSR
jgi:hypothetical protein